MGLLDPKKGPNILSSFVLTLGIKIIKKIIYQCYLMVLFCPRDELKRHYNLGQYWLEVSLDDLASFDEDLADKLQKLPAEHLPMVSHENF